MSKKNNTPLEFAMDGIHPFYYESLSNDFNRRHDIVDILKCHIVKMKTANLFVSKKNLLSISNSDDFQNRCEEEIASMKCEKVGNANVSFYDQPTKGLTEGGDLREAQVDVPQSI